MKVRLLILTLGILALYATGCQTSVTLDETATPSTATSVQPSPTTVADPPPTSSPTPPSSPTFMPSVTPKSTVTAGPTPIPLPTSAALPQAAPVVLLYADGYLARTDIDGSGIEQIVANPVRPAGESESVMFHYFPPEISPDGQWFITQNGQGRWDLLDARWEGQATGQGQMFLSPTWSPDSRRFAYLANGQLCIHQVADGTDSCLSMGENLLAANWSPTGRYIAVAQGNLTATTPCCPGEVWLIQVADGTAKKIGPYEGTDPHGMTRTSQFEWTATGDRLLVKGVGSYLYSTADGTTVPLPEEAAGIAADGRSILYRNGRVASLDGTIDYQLLLPPDCPWLKVGVHAWDWSPAGDRLAYLSSCGATFTQDRLYVVDAQNGEVLWEREITGIESPYPLEFVYWSPDGEYLLLDGPDEMVDSRPLSPIWRMKADGTGDSESFVVEGFLLEVVRPWME